jgi:hypothetical protein
MQCTVLLCPNTKYEGTTKTYIGFLDAVKTIYRDENIRGFFKGTRAALATVPIFYSIYFPIYEASKPFYAEQVYGDKKNINSVIYTLSAVTSALICDLFTNPMWVCRIRYQTEYIHSGCQKMDGFNVVKAVRDLYRKVLTWYNQ